jgi:hypothetical protein
MTRVVYEGESGLGTGGHIVLIAGDHEYRGKETLPASWRSTTASNAAPASRLIRRLAPFSPAVRRSAGWKR